MRPARPSARMAAHRFWGGRAPSAPANVAGAPLAARSSRGASASIRSPSAAPSRRMAERARHDGARARSAKTSPAARTAMSPAAVSRRICGRRPRARPGPLPAGRATSSGGAAGAVGSGSAAQSRHTRTSAGARQAAQTSRRQREQRAPSRAGTFLSQTRQVITTRPGGPRAREEEREASDASAVSAVRSPVAEAHASMP